MACAEAPMHPRDEKRSGSTRGVEGEASLEAQLEQLDVELEALLLEVFELETQVHFELAELVFEPGLDPLRLRELAERLGSIRELRRWARAERGVTARLQV
jgi:hypothetical protein